MAGGQDVVVVFSYTRVILIYWLPSHLPLRTTRVIIGKAGTVCTQPYLPSRKQKYKTYKGRCVDVEYEV